MDAVRLRLISDVPLGAFLSGGVDSSLVVALMKKVHTGTVRTFTIGFSVPAWDEAPHARRIAQHIGTQHEEVYLTEDNVLSAAREVGDYYDEPFADSSNIPTLALARMTRRHVTVALSGDGGDELFWGYSSYTNRAYDVFERLQPMPRAMRRMIGAAMRASPGRRWRPWGERLRHDDFAGYAMLPNIWLAWENPGLHRRTAGSESRVMQIAREVQSRLPGAPRDVLTGAFDLKAYLPDDILTKVDRATMSVALEARVPILDHRVVQLAAGIPIGLKTAGREQKHLLKKLLSRYVPRELWDRPKMGFGIPLAPWLRTSLREWTEDQLSSREGRLHDWLDSRVLRRVLDDHQQCKTDASQLIWACLQLAAWDRRIRSIQTRASTGQLQVA
jgi:asparagine synthase (glutamine-hydrolysing)